MFGRRPGLGRTAEGTGARTLLDSGLLDAMQFLPPMLRGLELRLQGNNINTAGCLPRIYPLDPEDALTIVDGSQPDPDMVDEEY